MVRKERNSSPRTRESSPHKPYLPQRFGIPERSSSLLMQASPDKDTLASLEKQQTLLKRKASEISQHLRSADSTQYLRIRQQQVQNHDEQFKTLHRGLRRSFEEGKIAGEEFKKEVDRCWTKRAKLAAENATITRQQAKLVEGLNKEKDTDEPDWAAAYAELLTNLYKPYERPAGWEARNEHTNSAWRQNLIERYDSKDPAVEGMLWCPISRMYIASQNCTAAHIVPHSLGCSNAGHIFGEGDDGFGVIWSQRNGIMMASWLEKQFDKGDFVLVPVEPINSELEPCEWRFVLMNDKIRKHRVGSESITNNDLDGRLLEWKNDNRPARRFLYYHFVTTLLRYVRYEKPGWAEKRLSFPTGKLWATQGPYLRRSTLRHLGSMLGDVDDADKIFADGVFDRKDDKPESEERLMAQEIFVSQECPKLDEEDIQVELEEQSVKAGNRV